MPILIMLQGFVQIFLTLFLVVILVPIVGHYLAEVFFMHKTWLDPLMNPLERLIYLLIGIEPQQSMTGRKYAIAVLLSNTAMAVLALLLLMFQSLLPLNPTDLGTPTWDTALHTTISFLVAADLQHYLPETTMSYLSQITALGFLMFVAPASGLAVGIAFIRGLTGRPLGNFYVDLTRSMTRVLLPLAIVSTMLLILGGVPETLAGPVNITALEGATQAIARGPIAHFESIKVLGENGGAFFGGNSAHPFENPNGGTNLLQVVSMLLIPTALLHTYGIFIGNLKQTRLLFWMVFTIFVVLIGVTAVGEYQGNPAVNALLGRLAGMSNPGFHGFTQVIYEYASAAAGNGSGFEGLADTQPAPTALWWNLTTAFTLWMGWSIPIIALLLLADSLSCKQPVPTSIATLNTDTQLFTSITAATILILGALTFFPVLVLGPIAEAFQIAIGR